MKNNILVLIAFLIISCNHINNIENEIGKAYCLIEEMKYEKAYKMLSKVLFQEPKNSRALNYKGLAALGMGDKDEAIRDLYESYEIDSLNTDINLNLGVFYASNNDFKNANKFYERAIALDSMCKKAYSNLGVLAYKEGKFKESLTLHEKAISIDSKFGGFYTNRGEALLALGDTISALKDYETAIQSNINVKAKLYTLYRSGMVYRDMKKYENAIKDFSMAIEMVEVDMVVQYNMDLYYYRGLSWAGLNNYKLALKDFKMAKELGKKNIDTLIEECNRFL
jgi:tetratricopeptide (TPR) repeat protein